MSDETTIEITVSAVVADAIRAELDAGQDVRAEFYSAEGFVLGEGSCDE